MDATTRVALDNLALSQQRTVREKVDAAFWLGYLAGARDQSAEALARVSRVMDDFGLSDNGGCHRG